MSASARRARGRVPDRRGGRGDCSWQQLEHVESLGSPGGGFAWTSSVNCGLSAISSTQSRSSPLCAVAILVAPADESPFMHTFFDAGIVVVSGVVALLLWDMGWRTDDDLTRLLAVAIGINGRCSSSSTCFPRWNFRGMPSMPRDLPDCCGRSRGHPPPTCCRSACARHTRCASGTRTHDPRSAIGLLILGAGIASDLRPHPSVHGADLARHHPAFAGAGAVPVALRRESSTGACAAPSASDASSCCSRCSPSSATSPCCIRRRLPIALRCWRMPRGLRTASSCCSRVTQMGTIDTARRMRAEHDLTRVNEALEDRVARANRGPGSGQFRAARRGGHARTGRAQDTRPAQPLAPAAANHPRHRRTPGPRQHLPGGGR